MVTSRNSTDSIETARAIGELVHSPEFKEKTRYLSMQDILNQRKELHAAHALREASAATHAISPAATVSAPIKPTGPEPVATGDIAFCFDGLVWDERQWMRTLSNLPKWLMHCLVIPGRRGGNPRHWNPVLIGAELHRRKGIALNSIRARFQTRPVLKQWLDAWKTYEADNFDVK